MLMTPEGLEGGPVVWARLAGQRRATGPGASGVSTGTGRRLAGAPAGVAAGGAAAAHVLPRTGTGPAYHTYTAAIEALDRPALFENRVCYRLLDADLGGAASSGRPGLRFGPSRYFDA